MNNIYSRNNISELFISLFPAQFFSHIATCLGGIINGLIIGNYLTSLDMVALGYVIPLSTIISVFSIVISSGARIICGKYIGRGNKEKVNETFTVAIISLIIIGIIITTILFIFSSTIATLLGANIQTMDKTVAYIRGIGIGVIPLIVVPCLNVFLHMENESTYALLSVLVLAISNFCLDYLCIRLLEPNIFIIGLCNSISQFICLLFIIVKFRKTKTLPRFSKIENKQLLYSMITLGLPSAMFNVFVAIRNTSINRIAFSVQGNESVNAISILFSSSAPFDAVAVGLASICMMLISIYIGEKDKESIKSFCKIAIVYTEIMTIVRMIIMICFGNELALLFGASNEVANYTIGLYICYALGMPFNILVNVFMTNYQALGKITYCNILYFICALIVPVTTAYIGGNLFGINGVWSGFLAQEIVAVILIYVIACIKKKRLVKSLDDLLFLDDEVNVGNHISISIKTIDEVVNISKQIQEYCLKENVDKKRSMLAGLCSEEIASNIVEHGFTKSKKKNNAIDIYCDVDDKTNDINIRIKDNAVSFDPHIKLVNNEDPTINIGIKIVSKIAKEMNYQNTLGLNVLSIKI